MMIPQKVKIALFSRAAVHAVVSGNYFSIIRLSKLKKTYRPALKALYKINDIAVSAQGMNLLAFA
jgi:uncharacterized protein with FMN-binding domain